MTTSTPARPTSPASSRSDLVRQLVVVVAEVFCVVGTLVGVGVLGTEVEQTAGGRLSAAATLIAPHGPAFSIWSVIYTGLFIYTLWHTLPAQRSSELARRTGYFAAVSMVLNASWLLVVQQGWLTMSVLVIVALYAALFVMIWKLLHHIVIDPSHHRAATFIVAPTFGLYLGWVSVATFANIAATAVARGVNPTDATAVLLTDLVLAIVVAIGAVYTWGIAATRTAHASGLPGRVTQVAALAAMTWGVAWIAIGRNVGPTFSEPIALHAAVASIALVLLGIVAAVRPRLSRLSV